MDTTNTSLPTSLIWVLQMPSFSIKDQFFPLQVGYCNYPLFPQLTQILSQL